MFFVGYEFDCDICMRDFVSNLVCLDFVYHKPFSFTLELPEQICLFLFFFIT